MPKDNKAALAWIKVALINKEVESSMVPLAVTDHKGAVKAKFNTDIADNAESRRVGMAKNKTVTDKEAMFFDTPGPYWMKGVPFDLDILFMSKKGTIVGHSTMEANTLNAHKPPLFAKYALEIKAGLVQTKGINVGDKISLNISKK